MSTACTPSRLAEPLARQHGRHARHDPGPRRRDRGATRHGWLAEFLRAEPRRLAEYGSRSTRTASNGTSGSGSTSPTNPARPGWAAIRLRQHRRRALDKPRAALGRRDGGPARRRRHGADGLVDPDPSRSFADVGGMSELRRRSTTGRPAAQDPSAFEESASASLTASCCTARPAVGRHTSRERSRARSTTPSSRSRPPT